MTYKLILGVFPFIIFLMTLIAFFNFDNDIIFRYFGNLMPNAVREIFEVFTTEVILTKRVELLSISLIVTIFSASSGFVSLIKGINKAYGLKESRKFIRVRIISMGLVIIFGIMIMVMLSMIIFKQKIMIYLIERNIIDKVPDMLDSLGMYGIVSMMLLIILIIIYKITICRRKKMKMFIPGAVFDIIALFSVSKIFNLYIDNFSKYSTVYGSIGGIFIMMLWINIISIIILIGGQINYMIEKRGENYGIQ